jgi:hypothetical protein
MMTDEEKLVADLYSQGHSTRGIASQTDMGKSKAARIVKDLGISRDRSESQTGGCLKETRVPSNWSFFPLTPARAWLVGLIFGDGSMRKDGHRVSLTSGDPDIIEKVNRMFDGRLYVSNQETYETIHIDSGRLWNELNKAFGLVPNKSHRLLFPADLPPDNMPHFVRGLIDSDGCWYFDTRSEDSILMFKFVSKTHGFVETFRNLLVSRLSVSKERAVTQTDTGGYEVRFSNQDAKRVANYVYRSSTSKSRCARKYNKVLSA